MGIASPASDYLRALPHWLDAESSALSRICVLYSGKGTFGWQVARGIMESAAATSRQSVELVPINIPLDNHDTLLRTLFAIGPEIAVLAGSFQDELGIMRTRHRWPSTVREVAAVAAGVHAFAAELGQPAEGVIGPSQWEPGVTLPNIAGPHSTWFLDNFQKQFGQPPDYIAAGSFATGLILTECIWRAASLNDEDLRNTASDLDCNTFYGRFRIDSRTGIQTGQRLLLERNPNLRYQHAADMRTDLQRLKRDTDSGKTAAVVAITAAETPRWARWKIMTGVVALAVFIGALAAAVMFYSGRTPAQIDSIAVLPFTNTSGDPNTEYLSDGIIPKE